MSTLSTLSTRELLFLKLDLYYLLKQYEIMYSEDDAPRQLAQLFSHYNEHFWRDFQDETNKSLAFTRNHQVQYLSLYKKWGIIKISKFLKMSTHTVMNLLQQPIEYKLTNLDNELKDMYEKWETLKIKLKNTPYNIGLVSRRTP